MSFLGRWSKLVLIFGWIAGFFLILPFKHYIPEYGNPVMLFWILGGVAIFALYDRITRNIQREKFFADLNKRVAAKNDLGAKDERKS